MFRRRGMMQDVVKYRFILLVFALLGIVPISHAGAQENLIRLTQTGCQFVEAEGVDHGFQTLSAADCDRINTRTGEGRLAKSEVLELKPGRYVFRVSNENVPYVLGFWLRGAGLARLTLPSVSGGGVNMGESRDYEITLAEGEYHYSCPLNPTPDYRLVVKQ